jgi:hypothetical protein
VVAGGGVVAGAGLGGSCGAGCAGRGGAGAPGNGFGTGVCCASSAATSSVDTRTITGIIRVSKVFSWVELKYDYA